MDEVTLTQVRDSMLQLQNLDNLSLLGPIIGDGVDPERVIPWVIVTSQGTR